MTTADRQACERELLDDYRRALAGVGGPELDRDDLWDRYRQGALYAYVAPLITAGMGGMQAEGIAMEVCAEGWQQSTTSRPCHCCRSRCDCDAITIAGAAPTPGVSRLQ